MMPVTSVEVTLVGGSLVIHEHSWLHVGLQKSTTETLLVHLLARPLLHPLEMMILIIVDRLLSLGPSHFSRLELQSFLLARVFARLQFPLHARRGSLGPTNFGLRHHAQPHVVVLHLPHGCSGAARLRAFGFSL